MFFFFLATSVRQVINKIAMYTSSSLETTHPSEDQTYMGGFCSQESEDILITSLLMLVGYGLGAKDSVLKSLEYSCHCLLTLPPV